MKKMCIMICGAISYEENYIEYFQKIPNFTIIFIFNVDGDWPSD